MTVLGRYLASVSQPDMFSTASGFDEFAAPDGTVRQGWSTLAEGLDEFAELDLLRAQREVERLLEDDNVTYTPNPAAAISIADESDGSSARDQRAAAVEAGPPAVDLGRP